MNQLPSCLRCSNVELRTLKSPSPETSFFECPACRRQYAKAQSGLLTYRWGHPISLALYGVLFETDPVVNAWRIAHMFVRDRSPDELAAMTDEIELELAQPTQQVRDILGNDATEDHCRQFLASFLSSITAAAPKS